MRPTDRTKTLSFEMNTFSSFGIMSFSFTALPGWQCVSPEEKSKLFQNSNTLICFANCGPFTVTFIAEFCSMPHASAVSNQLKVKPLFISQQLQNSKWCGKTPSEGGKILPLSVSKSQKDESFVATVANSSILPSASKSNKSCHPCFVGLTQKIMFAFFCTMTHSIVSLVCSVFLENMQWQTRDATSAAAIVVTLAAVLGIAGSRASRIPRSDRVPCN